jgi:hypothetical protein
VSPEVIAVFLGEGGRVERLFARGRVGAGVLALEVAGRVWHGGQGARAGWGWRAMLISLSPDRTVRFRCHGRARSGGVFPLRAVKWLDD